jgi:hypothetical protein
MKKEGSMNTKVLLITIVGAALAASNMPAQAHDYGERGGRSYGFLDWHSNVERRVNHLNRMVGHVRWQLTRYHPDGAIRRDFADIRREVDSVNGQYRSSGYDKRELRRQVERLHERLHNLEVRMRVRSNDYYAWR